MCEKMKERILHGYFSSFNTFYSIQALEAYLQILYICFIYIEHDGFYLVLCSFPDHFYVQMQHRNIDSGELY